MRGVDEGVKGEGAIMWGTAVMAVNVVGRFSDDEDEDGGCSCGV